MILTLSQARLPEIMPEFFSSWVGVLILVGGLILMVQTIVNNFKAKKVTEIAQPFPIRFHEEVPTRKEFDSLVAKVGHMETSLPMIKEAIISEIHKASKETGEMIASVSESASEKRKAIWTQVNLQRERISTLEAKTKRTADY
jgi:predicted HAD superfamily phosphohydrolase YqeG